MPMLPVIAELKIILWSTESRRLLRRFFWGFFILIRYQQDF